MGVGWLVTMRLLDLFCGAGGSAMGYHRAFPDAEIVGVDINPQPNYPFTFVQGDAMTYPLDGFDFIHASPPCQAYSVATQSRRNAGHKYPDLLAETRDRLIANSAPWVIENVPGAPIRADYKICGCQVGLDVRRVRLFETSWRGYAMLPPHHHPYPVPSVVGHGTPSSVKKQLGYNPTIAQDRACMGIEWMTRVELSQAIPPAYTEWIGNQFALSVGVG